MVIFHGNVSHNEMVTGSRNRGEKMSFRTTQWYSLSGMILPVIWVVADQLALRYCWLWHMRYCWLWHIDKHGGKHVFFHNGTCHNDVIMSYKTREQQIIITGRKIIEGSLEVKLPTIWTDDKQSREEKERRESFQKD